MWKLQALIQNMSLLTCGYVNSNKWVFVDAQFDAIPELDGVPLNAVEFQDALSRNTPGILILSASSGFHTWYYKKWIGPYLYYFDFSIDQRFFVEKSEK
ncbi:MAG: hypothetical protein ACE5OR_06400 [bacterium]